MVKKKYKVNEKYLEFDSINLEIRQFYDDLDNLAKMPKQDRENFILRKTGELDQFISELLEIKATSRINYDSGEYYSQFFYSHLGVFYELLLKTCLLKNNWDFAKLIVKKENKNFEYVKNQVLKELSKKLDKAQLKRMKEVFDYIQIQRNNFVHSAFKSFGHYAIEEQIWINIIVLNSCFKLGLNVSPLWYKSAPILHVPGVMEFEKVGLEKFLMEEKTIKQANDWEKIGQREDVIKKYENSWKRIWKEINPHEIAFMPLAEPHVIITDWYENEQEWYDLEHLIPELMDQSLVCYYKQMYWASFLVAVNCLELTIKYELIRTKTITPDLLKSNEGSFSKITTKKHLEKINLKKYFEDLKTLNKARNGLLHYNFEKLDEASKKILKTLPEDFNPSKMVMTEDFAPFAYFAYQLSHRITKELYGEHNRRQFIKEGLDDYERKTKEDSKEIK